MGEKALAGEVEAFTHGMKELFSGKQYDFGQSCSDCLSGASHQGRKCAGQPCPGHIIYDIRALCYVAAAGKKGQRNGHAQQGGGDQWHGQGQQQGQALSFLVSIWQRLVHVTRCPLPHAVVQAL